MSNLGGIFVEHGRRHVNQQEFPVCYFTTFGEQQPEICAELEPQRA